MKRSLTWLWLIGAVLYAVSTWLFADAVHHRDGQEISSSTADPTSPVSGFKKAEYIAAAQNELPAPKPSLTPEPPVADAAVDEKSTAKLDPATSSVGKGSGWSSVQRRTYAASLLQKVLLSARRKSVQSLRSPNVKPDGFDLLIPPHQIPAGFMKGFWLRWMRFPSQKSRLRPKNLPSPRLSDQHEMGPRRRLHVAPLSSLASVLHARNTRNLQ